MKKILIIITLINALTIPNILLAQFRVDVESGLVKSGYNDVRIRGDNGTLFSFSDELKSDDELFYRIKLDYKFFEKHNLSILYAPLTINATGTFEKDVMFQNITFLSNTETEGTYTFNSYRFTYRYDLYLGETIEFGLGLTGKIRDAEISLKNNEQESTNDNIGFVPLINFRFFLKLNHQFGFLLTGDALAAPQGRAEDILAAITYYATDNIKIKLGYRILEGGADNDKVYTFSLFHYASFGVIFRL
jgi:hypothetical protein